MSPLRFFPRGPDCLVCLLFPTVNLWTMFQAAQKLGGYELVSAHMCRNAFFLFHPGPSLLPFRSHIQQKQSCMGSDLLRLWLCIAKISQIANFCPRYSHERRCTPHLYLPFSLFDLTLCVWVAHSCFFISRCVIPFKAREGDTMGFKPPVLRLQQIISGFMSELYLICTASPLWAVICFKMRSCSCRMFPLCQRFFNNWNIITQ